MKSRKNWGRPLLAVLVLVCLGIFIFFANNSKASRCGEYRSDKPVRLNGYKINAEQAATGAQREKGLGGRACIESGRGMLFVFDHPGTYAIWMKDMKFPIDIVWISQDHKVVGIEKNIDPSTYPDRFANRDKPAKYVLELQAGKADAVNLKLNDQVSF
jgi:uncharacterized membrane protein (UPF0127 family)